MNSSKGDTIAELDDYVSGRLDASEQKKIIEAEQAEQRNRVAAVDSVLKGAVLTVRWSPIERALFAPWQYELALGEYVLAGRVHHLEQVGVRASEQLAEHLADVVGQA